MNFLDRAAIKREARSFISQNSRWWTMFLAMLPLIIATSLFGIIASVHGSIQAANGETPNSIFSTLNSVVGVLAIPFQVAFSGYFLNHLRGFNPDWQSPYNEGKDRYGKYLEVGFVTGLIIFLWSLLFVIPGIVKAYAYSQVNYIVHDNPNLSSSDVRRMSDIMTKGYKSDLFVKDLSFILWYLFVGVTCGIGTIYVTPYVKTVEAMYYENLKAHAIQAGLIAPEAFGILPVPPVQEDGSAYGSFESYQAPAYGQPQAPAYGQPQAPVYGQPQAPVYGQPQAPVYGQPQPPVQPSAPSSDFHPQPIIYTSPAQTQSPAEPVQPEAAPVENDRPIILNGEEYKPEDNTPKDM